MYSADQHSEGTNTSMFQYEPIAPKDGRSPRARKAFALLLVLFLAAVVYYGHSFEGALSRDNAIYLYSGQRMAEGIPPYVSIFDHKGPLAPMLVGVGVVISKYLGATDITAVRGVFFLIGCLAVVASYGLGNSLFKSQRAGLFTALTFLGFFGFARYAVSSPEAKTPMVLFEVLCLLFASQRRWALAGLCGSLAALVWQPMAVFSLVVIVLAVTQKETPRLIASLRAVGGASLPVVATGAYFYFQGALDELVNGSILFNARYLDREQLLSTAEFFAPVKAIFQGYDTILVPIVVGTMLVAVVIGLVTLGSLHLLRKVHGGPSGRPMRKGAFAPIFLSLPFPVLWSLVDFQGYPDFYVFIPYVAVGFGGFLGFVVGRVGSNGADLPGGTRRLLTVGLSAVLVAVAVLGSLVVVDPARGVSSLDMEERPPGPNDLDYQRQAAAAVQERFGEDAKVVSIGAPQLLVLLHKTNPNPYAFIIRGIDDQIAVETPGGFEGWIQELEAYDPDVIAFGRTSGTHSPMLLSWLESRYKKEKIGPWTLYVKETGSGGESAEIRTG